jgi:hypothetical protein
MCGQSIVSVAKAKLILHFQSVFMSQMLKLTNVKEDFIPSEVNDNNMN